MKTKNYDFVTNAKYTDNDFQMELNIAKNIGLTAYLSEPYRTIDTDQLPANMHGLYIARSDGGYNLAEFWRCVNAAKNQIY